MSKKTPEKSMTVREYLEYAYDGANAMHDYEESTRIARALKAYDLNAEKECVIVSLDTIPDKSYEAVGILWHVDEEEDGDGLPAKVVIPAKLVFDALDDIGDVNMDVLYDSVSDWLSDEYGFCHEGFTIEEM